MLSSWAALGTGASEGLTGRSTSGCPGWAYTGLGSEYQKSKPQIQGIIPRIHKIHNQKTHFIYIFFYTCGGGISLYVTTANKYTDWIKKIVQLFNASLRRLCIHKHTKHTVSLAGRSKRNTTECCRLARNVRLDQLIWFIFTWLQANSARLSRRLHLTFMVFVLLKRANKNLLV